MMKREEVIAQVTASHPDWTLCDKCNGPAVRFFRPDNSPLMIALHPALTPASVAAQLAYQRLNSEPDGGSNS